MAGLLAGVTAILNILENNDQFIDFCFRIYECLLVLSSLARYSDYVFLIEHTRLLADDNVWRQLIALKSYWVAQGIWALTISILQHKSYSGFILVVDRLFHPISWRAISWDIPTDTAVAELTAKAWYQASRYLPLSKISGCVHEMEKYANHMRIQGVVHSPITNLLILARRLHEMNLQYDDKSDKNVDGMNRGTIPALVQWAKKLPDEETKQLARNVYGLSSDLILYELNKAIDTADLCMLCMEYLIGVEPIQATYRTFQPPAQLSGSLCLDEMD
jgi:hypothetical protein